MKLRLTHEFRCTIEDGTCVVASRLRFVGANGIAISHDRRTVYVNDPPMGVVHVMARQTDGSLDLVYDFKSKHILDNIEMSDAGILEGGTIPLLHTSHTVCENAPILSRSRDIDGRQVGCDSSPGGLLSISPDDPTDARSFRSYNAESSGGARQVDQII